MTITTTPTEVADLFGLASDPRAAQDRYNVSPSQTIPVVRVTNGARELAELRWGLVPHWNKDPKHTAFVNARSETLVEKPAFRDPFRTRRCLVPVRGFYEWKTIGKTKRPYFFRRAGDGLIMYAVMWDRWHGPNGPVDTVAVLTVPANELVSPLHDRMPAVLSPDEFAAWLDPKARPADLLPLLQPYPVTLMESWPVSQRVNSVGLEGADLLDAVPESPGPTWTQPILFDVA